VAVERNVFLGSRGKGQTREELGPRVAALAARQYGVVARRQLLRLGLSSQQIERLIRAGALHPIHRGVYAVGHPRLTREGRWMAAVLAGGPTAVLSHQSAGIHWAVLRPSPLMPQITTATRGRARPGISVHYSQLRRDEVTAHNGIPVTTVARTLLDLAAVLDRHRLERALAEAEHRRYADSPSLAELIERHRGRRGLATLRAVLSSGHARRGRTRSPLEDRFLRFVDGHGLERPDLNAPLSLGEGFVEVDCPLAAAARRARARRARLASATAEMGGGPASRPATPGRRMEAGAGHVRAARRRSRRARGRPPGAWDRGARARCETSA